MNTVYGIYDMDTRELLYVGCTCQPLAVRLKCHIEENTRYSWHKRAYGGPANRARVIFYWKVREGTASVRIKAIVQVEDRKQAEAIEYALIVNERPPFNIYHLPDRVFEAHPLRVFHKQRKEAQDKAA